MKQYKFCGAFVIDDNKKTVKLPNYTNTFLMGGTKDNIGASISAAIPNISGALPLLEGSKSFMQNTNRCQRRILLA